MNHSASTGDNIRQEQKSWLVYDGECPFCSEYVKLVRLRKAVGPIELVSARDKAPIVDEMLDAGFDLNEGMALKYNGRIYHGADCIHMLALLSTPTGIFNRFNAMVFRSKHLSRILYPVLRAGRNATLRILGRSRIDAGKIHP